MLKNGEILRNNEDVLWYSRPNMPKIEQGWSIERVHRKLYKIKARKLLENVLSLQKLLKKSMINEKWAFLESFEWCHQSVEPSWAESRRVKPSQTKRFTLWISWYFFKNKPKLFNSTWVATCDKFWNLHSCCVSFQKSSHFQHTCNVIFLNFLMI